MAKPFRTISAAAQRAHPGDVITVHAGTYRERIDPPRGGESDAKRIVYQVPKGEKVEIKGSEVIKDWVKVRDDVWKAMVPNTLFGGFNPYSDLIRGDWFSRQGRDHHTGAVYLNGDWLTEAAKLEEVLMPAGTAPAWLGGAGGGYLLNVAWLRPGEASGDAGRIPAAGFAAKNGTRNAACSEGGECLGFISPGDWVRYERMDFGPRAEQMEIRAASASDGGIIELRLGTPDGELLGTCQIPNTGGWQTWSSFKPKIKPLIGIKTLCLVFKGRKQPVSNSALNPQLWFAQVGATNTTIWAQFKGVNPNEQLVEINVRQTIFYPAKPGRNFITVRGFTMRHAATPWAPPTAEQIGLIGTHWSKGWIIENNVISHSVCSGVALGKHGDEFDNTSANTATGYVKTIERAHAYPIAWTKENIGSHIVRNNTISHCEQAGIVGSLGCAFSTVTGNVIHDIHVRRLFSGAEMAGIKFHGAIDTEISRNHIYRTCRGLWLDWMAQGARVAGNLFHGNSVEDVYLEVNHGPFLVDNNIFLSTLALRDLSEGGAYAHNLFVGTIVSAQEPGRKTPYHPAHTTAIAGLAKITGGDHRYFNNLFVGGSEVVAKDRMSGGLRMGMNGHGLWVYNAREFPLQTGGNVFVAGAKPCTNDLSAPVVSAFDPAINLTETADGFHLEITLDQTWSTVQKRQLVTTELLGKAMIPQAAFENADGTPLKIDTDYFGKPRNSANPTPGPFEKSGTGALSLQLW